MSSYKRSKSMSDLQQEAMERMSSESGSTQGSTSHQLATMRRARSHENMDGMDRAPSPQLSVSRSQMLSEKELRDHFNMPLNEVAKKFSMCTTALKKLCRKYGVMQWPHRKLRSLEKKIASLRAEQLLIFDEDVQRYTSDGGTHHHIDDEIRKLEQQREMLLNGDGQLHEGDWGGIGEDGDYEAGEGDEEGGHNNSGQHNNSSRSLSRNNSHNQLSSAGGGRQAHVSGRGAPARSAGSSSASREALNEHVLSLEEENVSLRALTRSLMNERHDLLSSLDSSTSEVTRLRRFCNALQSKLLSAGVKDQGAALEKLNIKPEGGLENQGDHAHDGHHAHDPHPHQHHPQQQHQQAHHIAQQQRQRQQPQEHLQQHMQQHASQHHQHQHQQQAFKFEGQQHRPPPSQRQPQQQHQLQLQHAQHAQMAPQGMSMYARGYRNVAGTGIEQHSAANTALTFAQNSPAFNSITASPGFGGMAAYGGPSPLMHSVDGHAGGQGTSASPFNRPVPPQMHYRTQPSNSEERELEEKRELEDNSLSWMAPEFDLDALL